MAKIVKKSLSSISKIKCFYRPRIGNFVVIAFKMLQMEFKFKYTILITKCVTHFNQFISVKVKKNLRKSQTQFQKKLRTAPRHV